jgi:two-component system alkaline phosphatase synthesis response regulator PhoP
MTDTILVVDDDPEIVRLVAAYLEDSGFGVIRAYDGEAALRAIRSAAPALVVLDVMLPGLDGLAILKTVRSDSRSAALPILLLTARSDDTDRIVGLELGADDYVTKPFHPREVVARVRAVLRRAGAVPASGRRYQCGALVLDAERHEVHVGGRRIDLTPTEFALLSLLIEQPGRAYSRMQLLDAAGGGAFEGAERTIDSHVKNLRRKMAGTDAPQIETVYGIGYRLLQPEQQRRGSPPERQR